MLWSGVRLCVSSLCISGLSQPRKTHEVSRGRIRRADRPRPCRVCSRDLAGEICGCLRAYDCDFEVEEVRLAMLMLVEFGSVPSQWRALPFSFDVVVCVPKSCTESRKLSGRAWPDQENANVPQYTVNAPLVHFNMLLKFVDHGCFQPVNVKRSVC